MTHTTHPFKRSGWRRFYPFESNLSGILLLLVLLALVGLPILYVIVKLIDRFVVDLM
jgi:hypothetical protein